MIEVGRIFFLYVLENIVMKKKIKKNLNSVWLKLFLIRKGGNILGYYSFNSYVLFFFFRYRWKLMYGLFKMYFEEMRWLKLDLSLLGS